MVIAGMLSANAAAPPNAAADSSMASTSKDAKSLFPFEAFMFVFLSDFCGFTVLFAIYQIHTGHVKIPAREL